MIYSKTELVDEDVNLSTEKMTEFVVQTNFLYGKAHMTSNVHTLLHLSKAVLLQGHYDRYLAFQFDVRHLSKHVWCALPDTVSHSPPQEPF